MFVLPKDFWSKTVKALAKHGPDPLLAFVLFVVFLAALLHGGIDPFFALLGLMVIWGGYHARCVAAEKHKERIAEMKVDNLEKTRGAAIRGGQRARLSRRYGKSLVKGK